MSIHDEAIAIIPARANSKRIPKKNIRNFNGKPALQRTVEAAISSGIFKRVLVSTDSLEIANLAEQFGAESIIRDVALGDDFTSTLEVIQAATRDLYQEGAERNLIVCCIYPVTPLLNYERINQAIQILIEDKSSYVFPVMKTETPPERTFNLSNQAMPILRNYEAMNQRTQEFDASYRDAGQFYVGRLQSWMEAIPIISNESSILVMRKYEVVDIDEMEDWEFAEKLDLLNSSNIIKLERDS